jgi:hypothetical protein
MHGDARNDAGQPIFTGEEKSITFRSEFNPQTRGNKKKYNILVKMKPQDMRFRNRFAF